MYTYRNNSGKTYINNSDYFVGCGIEWLLEEIFLFIICSSFLIMHMSYFHYLKNLKDLRTSKKKKIECTSCIKIT